MDKHYLKDTASGRIYASSRGALDGIGQMDISSYVKTDPQGGYLSLGRPLNSPGNEGDFYVAKDDGFIVFGSPHRGGMGGGDLFISFGARDRSWSDPQNPGAAINTPRSQQPNHGIKPMHRMGLRLALFVSARSLCQQRSPDNRRRPGDRW
jgi:hypothetical protein